jgi:hypothetical protein
MLKNTTNPSISRIRALRSGMAIALAALLLALSQPACSKKSKTEPVITSPVRIVLLPFNIPAGNKDLQWAALAAPILLAKTGEQAKDLDIIPVWQTMPTALTAAGTSRTLTTESAANLATWLSAKWALLGELAPSKNGVSVVIDFIPSKSNLIPFRYVKSGKLDTVGAGFQDAYDEFLRYLVARPMEITHKAATLTSMKDLAEAFDREYGWFVEPEPGKAQNAISELMGSDERLAQSLFNPSLYPSISPRK